MSQAIKQIQRYLTKSAQHNEHLTYLEELSHINYSVVVNIKKFIELSIENKHEDMLFDYFDFILNKFYYPSPLLYAYLLKGISAYLFYKLDRYQPCVINSQCTEIFEFMIKHQKIIPDIFSKVYDLKYLDGHNPIYNAYIKSIVNNIKKMFHEPLYFQIDNQFLINLLIEKRIVIIQRFDFERLFEAMTEKNKQYLSSLIMFSPDNKTFISLQKNKQRVNINDINIEMN